MADRILLKRSSTASAVPTAAQIEPGELATNTADGKVYARKGAAVVEVTDWPSADVVPQSEAEGGTATTARKWTAQRVRQAIVAWWNSITSAFGRGFVAAADADAGRSALGLGTAAIANVTTSSTDTTAGRLLKVGDFGVGGLHIALHLPPLSLTSWDQIKDGNLPSCSVMGNGLAGGPAGLTGWLIGKWECNAAGLWGRLTLSEFLSSNTQRSWSRSLVNGVWSSWAESYNTSNLIYAQYSGAGSVAPHATTAGSNLTPARTGTWRNVSNTVVNNGAYALWVRV